MSKYIIRNCPAIYGDEYCKENTYEDGSIPCQNCTDCLLKQIVEKCRKAQEIMDKEQYYEDDFDTFNGESIMAETIMDMLDIEEC